MFEYPIHLLIIILIYILLTASLNLTLGYTGLLNLGHIAFFAIGAYASALLVKSGAPFIIAFIAAGILAAIFGLLLIIITRKLRGDYLALATLGFSYVTYSILLNWQSLTRGPLGLPGIPRPSFFSMIISSNIAYLIFTAVIVSASLLIIWLIVKSPFGRLLQATRDDEMGLRVLGKNTDILKYKAMALSACFAGIAGSLFAHYISYIDPKTFTLNELIIVLTLLIVGGIASLRGSIIAPFIILSIPELLRFIALPTTMIGPVRQIFYALLLLAILFWKPKGLFGRIDLP